MNFYERSDAACRAPRRFLKLAIEHAELNGSTRPVAGVQSNQQYATQNFLFNGIGSGRHRRYHHGLHQVVGHASFHYQRAYRATG